LAALVAPELLEPTAVPAGKEAWAEMVAIAVPTITPSAGLLALAESEALAARVVLPSMVDLVARVVSQIRFRW